MSHYSTSLIRIQSKVSVFAHACQFSAWLGWSAWSGLCASAVNTVRQTSQSLPEAKPMSGGSPARLDVFPPLLVATSKLMGRESTVHFSDAREIFFTHTCLQNVHKQVNKNFLCCSCGESDAYTYKDTQSQMWESSCPLRCASYISVDKRAMVFVSLQSYDINGVMAQSTCVCMQARFRARILFQFLLWNYFTCFVFWKPSMETIDTQEQQQLPLPPPQHQQHQHQQQYLTVPSPRAHRRQHPPPSSAPTSPVDHDGASVPSPSCSSQAKQQRSKRSPLVLRRNKPEKHEWVLFLLSHFVSNPETEPNCHGSVKSQLLGVLGTENGNLWWILSSIFGFQHTYFSVLKNSTYHMKKFTKNLKPVFRIIFGHLDILSKNELPETNCTPNLLDKPMFYKANTCVHAWGTHPWLLFFFSLQPNIYLETNPTTLRVSHTCLIS